MLRPEPPLAADPDLAHAAVALGSNLNDPPARIAAASAALAALPGTRLLRRSSLYRSRPMGPTDQPAYLNAVAVLETALTPHALLAALLAEERHHGRVRNAAARNGPRTLDLDLLLYDAVQLDTPDLRLPHPGIAARDFVLVPLLEVWPDAVIPGRGPASGLLPGCGSYGLELLPGTGPQGWPPAATPGRGPLHERS